jgi:hypothetical protein
MIAYAAYVISIDGRPLVSTKFQSSDSIPNEILFGGLVTALQGVASELTENNSELKSMKIEDLSYHFKSFGYFRIVLVTDLPDRPENVIHKIGLRFMKEHGEQIIDLGLINESDFESFQCMMKEIIQDELVIDESNLINPTKKFNTSELVNLDETIQPTALALIALKEGTANQIAKESGIDEQETFYNIHQLQEKGLIGKKKVKGETTYFCLF